MWYGDGCGVDMMLGWCMVWYERAWCGMVRALLNGDGELMVSECGYGARVWCGGGLSCGEAVV